jgi:hypothetical protein
MTTYLRFWVVGPVRLTEFAHTGLVVFSLSLS